MHILMLMTARPVPCCLDTVEGMAEKHLRPYLKDSDLHPPQLIDGKVKVHPAIRDFYKAFAKWIDECLFR